MEKNDIVSVVEKLQSKYESDPYMCVRFQNFICNQLPNIMESIALNRQQRVVRTDTGPRPDDQWRPAYRRGGGHANPSDRCHSTGPPVEYLHPGRPSDVGCASAAPRAARGGTRCADGDAVHPTGRGARPGCPGRAARDPHHADPP